MKTKYTLLNGLIIILFAVILAGNYGFTVSKLSSDLLQRLNYNNPEEKNLVWIYFTDKGAGSDSRLTHPGLFLTEKCIERRLKRIKGEELFDERDIPVNREYVSQITETGIKIKQKSKWFNGVSCYANKTQIENISGKDFIKRIELVQRYKKADDLETFQNQPPNPDYEFSAVQSNIINVPLVHASGISGDGILIANFDAGFDNLDHYCFRLIREKGLRTYDFVNGDTIVADGEGRLGTGKHGTFTLSLVAGYSIDSLVSPAFHSKFILAKTENNESETPVEEDNWIAAVEWADSLGADIITSSLGYTDFDPPYPDYTWQSMDGETARITLAADIAVSKGIVVVVSAGNAGFHTSHNTLSAPADAFDVIAVGSVNANRLRASYSSVGPTVDGRIKPDVMAMGSNNFTAKSGAGNTGYINNNVGTSLACPMIAGVCGLMLSANPDLTPLEVRNILKSTADKSSSPNNLYGWGIVDPRAAVQNSLALSTNIATDFLLTQNYPNPFNPQTSFRFILKKDASISLLVYDASGRLASTVINNVSYTPGVINLEHNFSGLSSGVYFYTLVANGNLVDSKKMVLVK